MKKINNYIVFGHLDYQKTPNLLACNYYWPKIKDIINIIFEILLFPKMLKFLLKISIIVY